jgi:ankyrin repeat protein
MALGADSLMGIVVARWRMNRQEEVFKQAILIDRFNEFARLAKEYLHIDIAPLNEQGCCFALAQYYIKHAREHSLDTFYQHISYITSQFTDKGILTLLERAKPQRTAEQEAAFISEDNSVKQPALFNNFQLPQSTYQFKDLMNFAQGISQAQVGYQSLVAKGRFANKVGQYGMGRAENLAANWDNSFPIFGNKKAILAALEKLALPEHHYAMIGSGNHAISFNKTADNRYCVYDSNDPFKPRVLNSLAEIADAIVADFDKVGNLTNKGEVGIVIDTLSFGQGDLELQQAIQQYRASARFNEPKSPVAQECHRVVMSTNTQQSLLDQAFSIYELYTLQKEQGLVKTPQDFIKPLPPALQTVAKECINYVQNAAFADAVETKMTIEYDDSSMSTEQKAFMAKISEYFAQYHNGHLSRVDFAANVLRNLGEFMASPEVVDFREHKAYGQIMKLKNDLITYREGRISGEEIIKSLNNLDLNKRDNSGFSITNHLLQSSPNKATLQALFAQSEANGRFRYQGENVIDRATLTRLLSLSNTETVEFIATKIDLVKALTVPVADSYELCLLSSLPDKKPENAEKGKIYLSAKGDYYLRDPAGQLQKGALPKDAISLKNLANQLTDPGLIALVHAQASKSGFTKTSLLLPEVLASGNTPVIKWLLNTLPAIDVNQSIPISKQKPQSILGIAVEYQSDSLALLALQKGAKLTPEAAKALLAKADIGALFAQYQQARERQDYTFEHFKADTKAGVKREKDNNLKAGIKQNRQHMPTEEALRSAWRAIEAKTLAMGVETALREYTKEQFQAEHVQEFQQASQWQGVVDTIVEQGDKSSSDKLFEAAVSRGMLSLAEKLLLKNQRENPALENEQAMQRKALLNKAVASGDTAVVKRLIEQDPSLLNAMYVGMKSILAQACEENHHELAMFLAKKGADVNSGIPSPLYYAAKAGDSELVKRLMKNGANNDPKSAIHRSTPLMAIMEANISIELKNTLFGVIYDGVKLSEFTAATVQNAIIDAVKLPTTTLESIKHFADKFKITLSRIDTTHGNSLAMMSLAAGQLELAKSLMEETQQGPLYKNKNGESLLSIALNKIAEQESYKRNATETYNPDLLTALVDQVKFWVKKDKSLANQTFGNGDSVLMLALQSTNSEITNYLIGRGANVHYVNPQTGSAAIHTAAAGGDISLINLVRNEDPRLGVPDNTGKTPMQLYAERRPTYDLILKLKGPNENLDDGDSQGNTLLHVAVKRGEKSREFIKALLKSGLDPLQKNQEAEPCSALDIALRTSNPNISALMAITEHLSSDALVGDLSARQQLETHRAKILAELKKELGATERNNPEAVTAAITRIERLVNMKNVLGVLLKEQPNVHKTVAKLLSKLPINLQSQNPVFKELKAIKASLLKQDEAKPAKNSRINPKRFKNL